MTKIEIVYEYKATDGCNNPTKPLFMCNLPLYCDSFVADCSAFPLEIDNA